MGIMSDVVTIQRLDTKGAKPLPSAAMLNMKGKRGGLTTLRIIISTPQQNRTRR
jgi:hypothetical protein